MIIKRNYQELLDFIDLKQSVLVFGPRGSGKTFFLEKIVKEKKNNRIIDLLDSKTYFAYAKSPELFASEIEADFSNQNLDEIFYYLVDEIQRLPTLLNEIHKLIHKYDNQVVFILTGSSARKLKTKEANLLAGRALSCFFYPFSYDEVDLLSNLPNTLHWGSLPKCFLTKNESIKKAYLQTYTNTYLEEEIQRESEIRKLGIFSQFLELAANENGKIVNYTKLGKTIGIHPATVKEYFGILSDTLIANKVPAWSQKIRIQLQKSPKYYFFDCGVINALTGNLSREIKPGNYHYGMLFESFIVNEIIRFIKKNRLELNFFHYRDQNQNEIDLIIQRNSYSKAVAIEIKSSSKPEIPARHPIRKFKDLVKNSDSFIICSCDRAFSEDGLKYFPIKLGIEKAIESALS